MPLDRRHRRSGSVLIRACVQSLLPLKIAAGVSVLRERPKRLLVGRPMRTERMNETLLPKKLALPVFCSDPISSVAYATEEILLVLALGGLALLHLTPWLQPVWRCCCRRRRVVPADLPRLPERRRRLRRQQSQPRPECSANGGECVARRLRAHGRGVCCRRRREYRVGLPVAGPGTRSPYRVGFMAFLAVVNLRGVKESGTAFAIPTYGFVVSDFRHVAVAGAGVDERLVGGGVGALPGPRRPIRSAESPPCCC